MGFVHVPSDRLNKTRLFWTAELPSEDMCNNSKIYSNTNNSSLQEGMHVHMYMHVNMYMYMSMDMCMYMYIFLHVLQRLHIPIVEYIHRRSLEYTYTVLVSVETIMCVA